MSYNKLDMLKRQTNEILEYIKVLLSELDAISIVKLPVGMALCIMPMRQKFPSMMLRLSTGYTYSYESISNSTQQLQVLSGLQSESNICPYLLVVLQFVCKQLLHPVS